MSTDRSDGGGLIDEGRTAPATTPAWFDAVWTTGVALVATVGSVGLALAVIGAYTTWLALLVGVPAAVAASVALHRSRERPDHQRTAHPAAAVALGLAVAFAAFTGATPSQHVLVDVDPASYLSTGRWLAAEGTLQIDARGEAFAGIDGLTFASAATYATQGDGDERGPIEPQFNHLTSTVLAPAYDIGGHRLLFRVPALVTALGLLVVYAVTVRVTRRPGLALAAPALLAVAMPFHFIARDTYSEPFTLTLAWGAMAVLVDQHRRPTIAGGVAVGLALGAAICARADALLTVAVLVPLVALAIATAAGPGLRRRRVRAATAGIATLVPLAALGTFDLVARTGGYASDLGSELTLLWTGVAGSVAVSGALLGLWLTRPATRSLPSRLRTPLAVAAPALVVAVLLTGWLVRPRLGEVTVDYSMEAVRLIQERDGLAVSERRNYAEQSLRWMAWYLGVPALLAAIAGFGLATRRAVRGPVGPALVTVLVAGAASGALYWWSPSVAPDHLFATRRFVPMVFPALAVMATFALARTAAWCRDRVGTEAGATPFARAAWPLARAAWPLAVVGALVLIVPPALTTGTIPRQRTQGGFLQPVLELCDALPADAAVVMVGTYGSVTLPQTLRAWCGVPVAAHSDGLGPDTVLGLAGQVEANGHRLHLVTVTLPLYDPFLPVVGTTPTSTEVAHDRWSPLPTLDRPPDRYHGPSDDPPIQTPFALHVLEVPPAG